MRQWPLVLFTLAVQAACGLTAAATVFDASVSAAEAERMRPLALAIFPLAALGVLFSMAHLGRPREAWRALSNLGRSRLSREILLTAVFTVLALAYGGFWWMAWTDGRVALGAAASVAGIVAVAAAAAVYAVPTQPAWNSGWIPASFLGTSALLGGLVPALLIPWNGNGGLLRAFLGAALAGSLLLLVSAFWMVAHLSRRTYDSFTAVRFTRMSQSFTPGKSWWLGCHLALAGVLPAALVFRLWPEGQATPFAAVGLAAVVFGAAIGRAAMYWLGARYEPF